MAILLSSCGDLPEIARRNAAADSAADVARAAAAAAAARLDSLGGSWLVTESTSPMDDSPYVRLSLLDDDKGEPLRGVPSASLVILCEEDRTQVHVSTNATFSAMDAPEATRNFDEAVRLRVDREPAQSQVWTESSDGRALIAPRPIALARRLAGADTLLFEYYPHAVRGAVVRFQLRGLDRHIGKVAEACHWKL